MAVPEVQVGPAAWDNLIVMAVPCALGDSPGTPQLPAVTQQPPASALPTATPSRERSFAEHGLKCVIQGARPKSHHQLFLENTQ